MPDVYVVTDEDGELRSEYSATPKFSAWAVDVTDAAEMWADERWSDLDNPEDMEALVTSPDGVIHKVRVSVVHTVDFCGREHPKED